MGKTGPIIALDEWRAHGWIMPACVLGVMLVAVHNYTLGVMIRPLEEEFGWTRAQISIGPLIPSMVAFILAPLVGRAADRYGPRRIALFGVPFFCAALGLLGTATSNILSWWALYALVGFASMFIFPMIWTSAISARFDRNRGLALALALAGTGLAGSIMPLVATALLESVGWRSAYFGIAGIWLVIALPATFFLFDRGRKPGHAAAAETMPGTSQGDVRSQLLSLPFVKLAAAATLFALASCALTTNAVPILLGEDFSAMTAASLAGLIGIGSIIGRVGGGVLLDRFDGRLVAAGSVVAPAISVVILLMTQGSEGAAMAACLILGLAVGAEYDACAYLVSRRFAIGNFATLFGLLAGIMLIGNGIAPVIANYTYDVTHSYDLVLWALLPIFAAAALLFLSLGRTSQAEPVALAAG